MESIYQQALGIDFKRLHPEVQKRFGITSHEGVASCSEGTMHKIWGGKWFMQPFLYGGVRKHLTFPERGSNIPFSLENYAYQDADGREAVAWLRKFHFQKHTRRFDATMIYGAHSNSVIDYLGKDHDLKTTIALSVLDNGGIKLVSGPQTLYKFGFQLPVPMLFTGTAEAMEWFDEEQEHFHIHVEVKNKYFGTIFGYRGTFTTRYFSTTNENVPLQIKKRG